MKRCNLIKRFFIGLLLIVVASISANAQEGLYVKSIFQRFGHAKGCKMVTMQNAQLKGYKLKIYKSLVYKGIFPYPSLSDFARGYFLLLLIQTH